MCSLMRSYTMSMAMDEEIKRWTARRTVKLVLDIV